MQRPGGEQQPDTVRRQEQPARARGHRQAGQDHAAAAQVVRHRPEHQQGDQEQESVRREDGGQRDRREPPLGLVDAIQRRRGRSRKEQQEQHAGHQPERGGPRQLGPPRIPPGGPDRMSAIWFCAASRVVAAGAGARCGHRGLLLEDGLNGADGW